MNKEFALAGEKIPVIHKISPRTRSIRLVVHPGGKIVITTPKSASDDFIQSFVSKKSKWIKKKYDELRILPEYKNKPEEYKKHKHEALRLAKLRLEHFNQHYNFKYNRVSIKNSKSLWGSCSKKGNLNFNYKIALIPAEYADYVIVHELCHLKEFNHSNGFWSLVSETVPNHSQIRKSLKKFGLSLG